MDVPQRTTPAIGDLGAFFVGKDISDVPKPSLILDVERARRHCKAVLETVSCLGAEFRAHVKTHKVCNFVR